MIIKKIIPSFITSLNLICGATAVALAFNGEIPMAVLFILSAAVLDFFDGLAARLLNTVSEFGKQLDSLADLISFGMAPASLLFVTILDFEIFSGVFTYIALLLVVFSALRLAKFNIDNNQSSEFLGLPTPAMALFVISFVWEINLNSVYHDFLLSPVLFIIIILALCLLMVLPIRLFSLKIKSFKIKTIGWQLAFILLSIILLIIFKIFGFALIIFLYIALSLIRNIITINTEKK